MLAILLPDPGRLVGGRGAGRHAGRSTDPAGGSRRVGITPIVVILGAALQRRPAAAVGVPHHVHGVPARASTRFHGWEDKRTLLLGLVIGSAGLGSTVGTVIGSVLKARKPEVIVLVGCCSPTRRAIYAALFFSLVAAMILGLVAGLSQRLGKLSLDALIQREVPELVRTSVFARSETLLQLSWVIGGFLGVFMPLIATLGLSTVAASWSPG